MATVFTLLLALELLVLAPPLVEALLVLLLLLLEPHAATRTDSSATAAMRPMPRSARFCVRACMESCSPFVLAESKPDRVTLPEGPGRPPGGRFRAPPYLVGCQLSTIDSEQGSRTRPS